MNNRQTQSYIREVAAQTTMALMSDKTPEAVKDCLKTIISEAATEADLTISDFGLIGESLPNVIEKLPVDYGRGFLHSIAAIVRHDTGAFQEFYDRRLDEKTTAKQSEPKQTIENDMQDETKKNPLDDRDYATRKRLEMFELAKEMLAQIIEVTSGYCVIPNDREYAQKYLFAIFEMFMIRHDNFSRSQLAEDLQSYLFTWTRAHDDASRKFGSDTLAELGFSDPRDGTAAILSDAGAMPKAADKQAAVLDSPEQFAEMENESESLNALAKQLSGVLNNPLLPVEVYNVLSDQFTRIAPVTDTPENILLNLKALSDVEKKEQSAREAKNA